MSHSYSYRAIQDYPEYSNPLNVGYVRSWGDQGTAPPPPPIRGNLVHVNPAFYQPPAPINNSSQTMMTKVIVNPKFFPSIQQNEVAVVKPKLEDSVNRAVLNSELTNVPAAGKTSVTTPFSKSNVKYSRSISTVGGKNCLNNIRNKYSWKRVDTPPMHQLSGSRQVFKHTGHLKVTRSPVKSIKSCVKLSSPQGSFANSRFKVDNRLKKKFAGKLANKMVRSPCLPKILQTKYRLIIKRTLKRSTVNRSFTNFSNFKARSMVVRNTIKKNRISNHHNNKSISNNKKKTPSAKNRKSNRYYNSTENQLEETLNNDDDDEEVEIAEKPSSVKSRKPIGSLPSFITL